MMRVGVLAAILLALFLSVQCDLNIFGRDGDDDSVYADSSYVLTFGLTDVASFSPATVNGSISLQGTSTDSIRVEVRLRVGAETEAEASAGLALIAVDSTLADTGELRVFSEYPVGDSRNFQASYIIVLPAALPVSATTINGTVEAEDLSSSLNAIATNGNIRVEEHQGQLLVQTVNGNIDLEHIQGWTSAQTTNGSVEADNIVVGESSLLLRTQNGSVELSIPASTSAAISAECSNGVISISGLSIVYSVNQPNRKVGVIGDGGAVITLDTDNGDIRVRGF